MKRVFVVFASLFFLFCASYLFGFGDFPSPQPDFSGDFVYYRDLTFKSSAYIGFLYYDDATYAVRFFSRQDIEQGLPQKDIMILFSLDPTKKDLTFTGEKIIGKVLESDVDTVNYIHDMFYEFYQHRQKTKDIASCSPFLYATNSFLQDFPQFGGGVTLYFNKIIPIFNLYCIKDAKNQNLLETVCLGTLESSDDKSFENFFGFDYQEQNTKTQKIKKAKKQAPASFDCSLAFTKDVIKQNVTLDEKWQKIADGVFSLTQEGGTATLSLLATQFEPSVAQFCTDALFRSLLQSSAGVYTDMTFTTLTDKSPFILQTQMQEASTKKVLVSINEITQLENNAVAILNLTIDSAFYKANKDYFSKILKTHTVKQQATKM